jgi:hydroxyacylglutathione hydrolase
VAALKAETGCFVVGPGEARAAASLDLTVGEGDSFDFSGHVAKVFATPGHTLGHIVYWLERDEVLFAGDTLFSLGCGRVFEGTFAQMWSSLERLGGLPPETTVYCGHEYTQANARFAMTIEPGNAALTARTAEVDRLRAAGNATLPTTIGAEREANPFLRPDSAEIQERLGLVGQPLAEVFAEIRRRKDRG